MPQREPLSAPLLGALAAVAGLAGGWVAVALAAVAQGAVGALAGFPWRGIRLLPSWLPQADLGLEGSHGPGAWALMLLAGPVVAALVGLATHLAAERLALPPPPRTVAFQAFGVAWLQVPLLLLSAGFSRGSGPFAALYERLGEPETGRWAVFVLAGLALWGAAGLVAGRAVELGREWLRADSLRFRRRLVLLYSGYPFAAAVGVAALMGAFESPVMAGLGAVLVVAALWLRTR